MKYIVKMLPTEAMHSPTALAKWLNQAPPIGLELVAVDGRNYIFKEIPVYTK